MINFDIKIMLVGQLLKEITVPNEELQNCFAVSEP